MMDRKLSSLGIAAALAAGLFVAAPGTALARDQTGFGIGANLNLGTSFTPSAGTVPLSISGLAGSFWVSPDIMLEFMIGVGWALNDPPGPGGGDATFGLGGNFGVFGVLADGGDTNLMLGGRLGVIAVINYSGIPDADDNQAAVRIDIPLRVEHWFDEHFAINGQVGIAMVVTPDTAVPFTGNIGSTSGFFGGAGFTYYLDGSGNAPASASRPSSSSSSSSSSSAPPPAGSGSSDAAPWE
jgi:hypothetical protein